MNMDSIDTRAVELPTGGRVHLALGQLLRLPSPDILITSLAAIALFPALRLANLPFSTDWKNLAGNYVVLGFQGVVLAAILWSIQSPGVFAHVAREHWHAKPKLFMFGVFVAAMDFTLGVTTAAAAAIFALALSEYLRWHRGSRGMAARQTAAMMGSGAYFFLGFLFVIFYSSVVIRLRFFGAYDTFFNNIDLRLFGTTVSAVAHRAAVVLPAWSSSALNAVYFGMFPQIGATVVICTVSSGGRRARQFVGTVVVGYCMAVLIYAALPNYGPYRLCPNHVQATASASSKPLIQTDAVQNTLVADAEFLSSGKPVAQVPIAYYIGFPCMHLVQPLIVLWFLRKWKRIFMILAIYDVVMVASIVLLELHFFADLLGAVAVAAIAILLMDRDARGIVRRMAMP